jgi:hypothetical protein
VGVRVETAMRDGQGGAIGQRRNKNSDTAEFSRDRPSPDRQIVFRAGL